MLYKSYKVWVCFWVWVSVVVSPGCGGCARDARCERESGLGLQTGLIR